MRRIYDIKLKYKHRGRVYWDLLSSAPTKKKATQIYKKFVKENPHLEFKVVERDTYGK